MDNSSDIVRLCHTQPHVQMRMDELVDWRARLSSKSNYRHLSWYYSDMYGWQRFYSRHSGAENVSASNRGYAV
jgi:hypothetical protein